MSFVENTLLDLGIANVLVDIISDYYHDKRLILKSDYKSWNDAFLAWLHPFTFRTIQIRGSCDACHENGLFCPHMATRLPAWKTTTMSRQAKIEAILRSDPELCSRSL